MVSSPETRSSTSSLPPHNPTLPTTRRIWSREEDEALIAAVAHYGTSRGHRSNWPRIAAADCSKRWFNSLDPAVKKGKWSQEEDDALRRLYAELGPKWKSISQRLPGRQEYQVAKRWGDVLSPDLASKEPWSPLEDALLLQLYETHGSKWSIIAESLTGRSPVACRNRCRKYHGQPPAKRNNASPRTLDVGTSSNPDQRCSPIPKVSTTTTVQETSSMTSTTTAPPVDPPMPNDLESPRDWQIGYPVCESTQAAESPTGDQLLNRWLVDIEAAITKNGMGEAPLFDTASWDQTSTHIENSESAEQLHAQEINMNEEVNTITTGSTCDTNDKMIQLGFSNVDSSIPITTLEGHYNVLSPSNEVMAREVSISSDARKPLLPPSTPRGRPTTLINPVDNVWSLALALQTSQTSIHISTKLLRRLVHDAAYTLCAADTSDVSGEAVAQQ
ncbi:hypothetical protein PFICI_11145 [Pestalotiopsis fici W106-1]|uniref:Uncharacterized protein n=1 Tax=Pestalotiopsis fici (strain W106-1 / CGMCC3.15140) TaxID=1229662 RepID=W3WWN0_PESFW|nr:uncharacterized protein PFICI_11145 [Pestalotiopsis fici W106-1]ETS77271.1 hypothetical protein PFICI_11145 [Pestalotiopsis fici W106-1]